MKKQFLFCMMILLSLHSLAQKPQSVDYSSLIKEYRELLKTEMPKNNIVGLSIALVDKDGRRRNTLFYGPGNEKDIGKVNAILNCS